MVAPFGQSVVPTCKRYCPRGVCGTRVGFGILFPRTRIITITPNQSMPSLDFAAVVSHGWPDQNSLHGESEMEQVTSNVQNTLALI